MAGFEPFHRLLADARQTAVELAEVVGASYAGRWSSQSRKGSYSGTSVEKTYSTMFVHARAQKFREKTYTPTPMVVNKLNIKRISGCRLRCRKA